MESKIDQAAIYREILSNDGWVQAGGKKSSHRNRSKKNRKSNNISKTNNVFDIFNEPITETVAETVAETVSKPIKKRTKSKTGKWVKVVSKAVEPTTAVAVGAGDVYPEEPILNKPKRFSKPKRKTLKDHINEGTPINLTLNVEGKPKKFSVCPYWASGNREHMCPSSRCTIKLNHPFIRKNGKPLELRTCLSLTRNGFCDKDDCAYQHPPELINKYSRFTNLCQAHHAKKLQDSGIRFNTTCYGCSRDVGKCFHCHDQPQQQTEKMEEFLSTDWSQVDIRILDNEFSRLFQANESLIREWVSAHDFTVINIHDLNFEEKLNYWARISSWIGKIEKGRPVEKSLGYNSESFKKWNLNLDEFGYDIEWLWTLYARINICKTHRIMLQKIKSNTPLVVADICVGGIFCKNGVHNPEDRISITNLMSGDVYDMDLIREERERQKSVIDDLKTRIAAGEFPEEQVIRVTDKKSKNIISKFKGLKKSKAVITQKTYPLAEKYEELSRLEIEYWVSTPGICPTRFGYKSPMCYQREIELSRVTEIKMEPLNGVVINTGPAIWETTPTTPQEQETLIKVQKVRSFILKQFKKTWFRERIIDIYDTDVIPRNKIEFWYDNFHHLSFSKFNEMFEARDEEYKRHLDRVYEAIDGNTDLTRADEFDYLDVYGWILRTPIHEDKRVISNSPLHQKLLPLFVNDYIDSIKSEFTTFKKYCKKQEWYKLFVDIVNTYPKQCLANPIKLSRYVISKEYTYGLGFREFCVEPKLSALWSRHTAKFGVSFEEFKRHPDEYNTFYSTTAHINETFEEFMRSSNEGWLRPRINKSGSNRQLNYWQVPITTKFKKVYNPTLDKTLITCSNNGQLCFINDDENNEVYEDLIQSFKSKDDDLESNYRECVGLGITGLGMTQVNDYLRKVVVVKKVDDMVEENIMEEDNIVVKPSKSRNLVGITVENDSDSEDEFGKDCYGGFEPEFSDDLRINEIRVKGKNVTNINGFTWSKKKVDDLKLLVKDIRRLGVSSKLLQVKKENKCEINIFTHLSEPSKQRLLIRYIRSRIGGDVDIPADWNIREEEEEIAINVDI